MMDTNKTDAAADTTPEHVVDLVRSRERIDEIDKKIVELFCERMDVVKDVAVYKAATGKAVFDAERERQKIERATAQADAKYGEFVAPLFTMLMELSRSYQDRQLHPQSELSRFVSSIPRKGAFPQKARVACQGALGSWAYSATKRMVPGADIDFEDTWEGVCDKVAAGEADFGVMPLENTTTGTVTRAWDLLHAKGLYVVRSVNLRIDQCLLAKPGTKLEDIREVFSHEQGLRQCASYLESLDAGMRRSIRENTASAARAVAQSERTDVAAIASADCAELYGLEVLVPSIQDMKENLTRFACFAKSPVVYDEADRTSLMLITPHEPGSLFRVISRFAALGINMAKLESRPIPGREFEFMFYLDVESTPKDEVFMKAAAQIPYISEQLHFLGSYADVSQGSEGR
ncbi:P-protein [Slackia heliotrinireducens]|uniref:Bifunctional chorismate mutase/prephenate dehydratase n=2 Tax=Slackia TaxID=84108 RepID=C7N568_SLAHD|nr:chorismate mutase [Slackia heliotrinireducens]ACV22053.1 monofunctional chorismate mutase, clade 2 [Slackia heliotrinireducens DSM 20476]VEH00010.1 P-protein [Slackia heliotrinireducens]